MSRTNTDKFCDLSVQDVYEKISEHPCILDVRSPEEFVEGCLPATHHINFFSETFQQDIQQLENNTPWIVYCRSGQRSMAAVQLMQDMGFTEVHNMTGGILAWMEAGLPFSEKPPFLA